MSKPREVLVVNVVQGVMFASIAGTTLFNMALTVRLAAWAGTLSLALLLIAPRLLKWPQLKPWHNKFLQIARNSKWMGIWTALWFILHAIAGFSAHLQFAWSHLLQPQIVLGLIALGIFGMILALSNKWSYQHVKWWKHLNMAVWLVVPLGFTHALLAASHYLGVSPLLSTSALFLLMLSAGFLAQFESERGYFTPHRTGLLVVGVLLGVAASWWSFAV